MAAIEVIATDGVMQKRIVWINITQNGIYYSFVQDGVDTHSSYHRDGNVFKTVNGVIKKIATFEPLDAIKGTAQIASFGFTTNLSKLPFPEYKMQKKLHNIIFVDVRTYKHRDDVGFNITLLEPRRYDLLVGIENIRSEIHLYTRFTPWLLLTID
jgi:hypothetical protein